MKAQSKSKVAMQAIFWGLISAAAFALVFLNQKAVLDFTTRGGASSLIVIAMALGFSFLHGSFANYFIEAIGFKPAKKK